MLRVLQITDTHISPAKAHFASNWAPVAAMARVLQPDLVVHTSDVTVDGADMAEDMVHCRALMDGLDLDWLAVPGNHDVGSENPDHHQAVNDERLARWDAHFGPDRWLREAGRWLLLGVDAMLMGSGHAREADQAAWVEAVLARSLELDGLHLFPSPPASLPPWSWPAPTPILSSSTSWPPPTCRVKSGWAPPCTSWAMTVRSRAGCSRPKGSIPS